MKHCVCCGLKIEPHEDSHDGRMDGYCEDCKWMRCDVSFHGKA